MDTILSAVLGDLVSRSVSFVINNYYHRQQDAEENLPRLRCVLLRIQTTVEEAEGRQITNQAMLQQLQMLREAMYKGCYLLDTFRYRMLQQEMTDEQVHHHPFALNKFTPAKRFCFPTRRINMALQNDGLKEVQKMLERLHNIIDNMAEFVAFLKYYPPITRQPYSMHLFLEKCMFGRQAEMENIINFLLQPEPPGAELLQVLPIIGPPRVGKRTLVEHVCYDERVRNHFSSIMLCSKDPTAPEGSDVLEKHINCSHAYWYFFKVMAFGSTNPDKHPELASIAMEIVALLDGSFLSANIISRMLRANLNARFWHKILGLERNHVQINLLHFGEHPRALYMKNQPAYIWSMSDTFICIKVHSYKKLYHQNDLPKIKLHEFLTGSAEAHGKFEVLIWKSCIPPYHSFIMSCGEAPRHMMAQKKRPYSVV